MGKSSSISWTQSTWNIAVGCTKVDSDCKFCYMYRDSMNETRYNPKTIRKTGDKTFLAPTKWKEPKLVFTSSLTDFFHEGCDSFRGEAWEVIRKCPQHTFQILTKRPERISKHLPEFWQEIKDRVWLGTSVGSKSGLHRIEHLLESGANCLYFLSIEPLYEEIKLPLWEKAYRLYTENNANFYHDMISWVIVGGESGNENGLYKYRPCKLEWIEQIVNQCKGVKIPVFVKQLGTHLAKELNVQKFTIDDVAHNNRHGTMIESFPESIRFQEMPIEANKHFSVWHNEPQAVWQIPDTVFGGIENMPNENGFVGYLTNGDYQSVSQQIIEPN